MVTLTQSAANEIKRQLAAAGGAEASVRIGLKAGGCAGTKYVLTPGALPSQNDAIWNQFGLKVLCDPLTLTAVEGLKIDFVAALMGGGFQFENPQAAGSCGCGASFRPVATESGNYA